MSTPKFEPLEKTSPDHFIEHLLGNPACWCQGKLACDSNRQPVFVDDCDAVSWCLDGALELVRIRFGKEVHANKISKLKAAVTKMCPGYADLFWIESAKFWPLNDTSSYREVLELVKEAGV